jgi:hypothetical protein
MTHYNVDPTKHMCGHSVPYEDRCIKCDIAWYAMFAEVHSNIAKRNANIVRELEKELINEQASHSISTHERTMDLLAQ